MDTESSSGLLSGILWFFQGLLYSVVNLFTAISNPQLWLDWSDKKALMRFIYYGGSTELFFVFLLCFIIIVLAGLLSQRFLWGFVRVTEGISNSVGRLVAWAGLIMVIQQVVIVFLQRIFARPDIVIGFGIPIEYGVSWFAEELKLYNAAIICLCISYTFVQQGHVRVDLFYAPASFRKKKIIDMCGAAFFMIPMAVLMWMYSWFFMWRHLITPKVSASDKIELMLRKACGEMECRDHRLFGQRLYRLFPVQGADGGDGRLHFPAGHFLLLPLSCRISRGQGQRRQVSGP